MAAHTHKPDSVGRRHCHLPSENCWVKTLGSSTRSWICPMATRTRRTVNALFCMSSLKHLKTRILQTILCPPCVRIAKNHQWQYNVWHSVSAFSTRWQARLGGPFRLTISLFKQAKNGPDGLWNKFGRLVCNGWHCYFRLTVRILGRISDERSPCARSRCSPAMHF